MLGGMHASTFSKESEDRGNQKPGLACRLDQGGKTLSLIALTR